VSDIKLGQQPTGDTRDAIHIAIVSVIAGTQLKPGAHVGLLPDGTAAMALSPIGIVDPFLTSAVLKGERFWLLLYQNTVTGMRHHWSHPSFKEEEVKTESFSKRWLSGYAITLDKSYDELISEIEAGAIYVGSDEDKACTPVPDEVLSHYQSATGKPAPDTVYFSCSC
jgi:hypothetical protein